MKIANFSKKIIMAVAAHPDDNDFGAAGTFAKAAKAGAKIIYVIATGTQKGASGMGKKKVNEADLSALRRKEQLAAAKILGVKKIIFLTYNDGEVVPTLELKKDIVKLIRQHRPDFVFTLDPSRYYYLRPGFGFVNHTDHRAVGEATIDACYPLARDQLFFSEQLAAGLKPHKVKELFLYNFDAAEANYFEDISKTINKKITALAKHKSQFSNFRETKKWITAGAAAIGKKIGVKYAEAFIRISFR